MSESARPKFGGVTYSPEYGIARRTDPLSSKLAAEEVTRSGKREGQCLAVLALVRRYPGRSSKELAKLSIGLDRYTVARRLPELAKEGLVRREDRNGPELTWWPAGVAKQEVLSF